MNPTCDKCSLPGKQISFHPTVRAFKMREHSLIPLEGEEVSTNDDQQDHGLQPMGCNWEG